MGKFVIGTKNSKEIKKIKEKMKGLEGKLEIASKSGDSCCPTLCKCKVYDGDWMTNKRYYPEGGLIISVVEPLEDLQVQADCDYTFSNYKDGYSAFEFSGLLVTVYYGGRLPKEPAKKKR